jgi:hypothetical protein
MYRKTDGNHFDILSRSSRYNHMRGEISSAIFSREDDMRGPLALFPFRNIVVLGVGGIGSWVAYFTGRIGYTNSITLIDPDIVEASNLNRTPFTIGDIGELKVRVAAAMISSIHPNVEVHPVPFKFDAEFVTACKKEKLGTVLLGDDDILVIDCRDNYYNDYMLFEMLDLECGRQTTVLRAAYDGDSVTINCDPVNHIILGSTHGGYTVTPSHVVPSAFAAMMIIIGAYNYKEYKEENESKRHIVERPITFKPSQALDYIYNGMMLQRLAESGNDDANRILQGLADGSLIPNTH